MTGEKETPPSRIEKAKGRVAEIKKGIRDWKEHWLELARQKVVPLGKAQEMIERGIPPIAGGAKEEEWEKVRGLKKEAGKLVRQFRRETDLEKRKELAAKLDDLIGEKENEWDKSTLGKARRAYHYMAGEIQKAARGKPPTPETMGAGKPPEKRPPAPPSPEKGAEEPEIIGEEVVESEGGGTRFRRYRFEKITQVVDVVRDWLDNTKILGDAPIHPLENTYIYDRWLGEAKKFTTPERERDKNKRAQNKQIYDELVQEYESVRRALLWWHEAARDKEGGFSKDPDKKTFANGISMGEKYTGEYIAWLVRKDSPRREGFIHGFATPRADVKKTHFTNASEYLGAMLRSSCGIGTKDEVEAPGKPKNKNEAGYFFTDSDGNKLLVVNARGEPPLTRTKGTNSVMYETHKQLSMDAYVYKYLRVRHKMIDTSFEPSIDPETGEQAIDPKTGKPVFICHLSADRLWAYDAFQHPKFMAPFWYANLDILDSDALNSKDLVRRKQNGRRFLEQLGWDPKKSDAFNKALLSTGYGFLGKDKEAQKNVSPEIRNEVCQELLGFAWNDSWTEGEKKEVLIKLGMVEIFGELEYGMKEHYILTTNLINLDDEKIPEDAWYKMDWSPLKEASPFLSDWCQQQVYLQELRNKGLLPIITGDNVMEGLEFLGKEISFRHISETIAPVAEREKSWWFEAASRMLILPYFMNRLKGQRVDEVAVPINQLLRFGLYKGIYAQEFEDIGLPGHDWTNLYEHPVREVEDRVAKILAKFNCRREAWVRYMNKEVLTEEVLAGTKFADLTDQEKFWVLVAFAGFRIRPDEKGNFDGYLQLRERIEQNREEIQPGRVIRYFEFDLDKKRDWGKQMFKEKLGEKGFEELMAIVDNGIKRSGMFSRFYEKMDEEEIVCKLIDRWLDEAYNSNEKNWIQGGNRAWGLPMLWYPREILFNQALRDMKYGIGKIGKLRGEFVLEQLEVDDKHMVKDKRTGLEAFNIKLEPNEVKDLKGKPIATVYQPIFPIFKYQSLDYCRGKDVVWSMLQGTGEWFPGMAKRLTPLYIHYNRDRYMNMFITLFFDPLFRRKVFENAGRNWEEDKAFFYIANPLKQRELLDLIDQLETDPDWAQDWRAKLNIHRADILAEFTRERKEIRVLNVEKAQVLPSASEEDIAALREITLSGFKLIEPTGLLAGRLGGIFGRTGKEFRQRLWAMAPGAITSFFTLGLPIITAPMAPGAGGFVTVLRGLWGIGSAFGGGIASSSVLGGDVGIDVETGFEREAYDTSILGTLRRFWKIRNVVAPFSLMRARIDARSYEAITDGRKPLWDDVVPVDVVKVFFESPKAKLQRYKPPA